MENGGKNRLGVTLVTAKNQNRCGCVCARRVRERISPNRTLSRNRAARYERNNFLTSFIFLEANPLTFKIFLAHNQ